MCSILLTNKQIKNLEDVNYYLRFRGPDHTTVHIKNGITFVHNLLSICGAFTTQPFMQDNIFAMHNGEIYNYGDYPSDGYCLIPSYLEHGATFTKTLDGEFAVTLVDFNKNIVIFSSDVFATKPLFYSIDGDHFGISTYRTPLEKLGFTNIVKMPANQIMQLDLATFELHKLDSVYEFDLTQHKTSFDDWSKAFSNAVRKRTQGIREKIFIGLSSGYDSGSIACELDKQGVNYHSFTVTGKEDIDIVEKRKRAHHSYITPTPEFRDAAHAYICDAVEPFQYTINSSDGTYTEYVRLHDDSGSNGLSMVCAMAQAEGIKIYLSGMGADELFSDYGFGGQKIYAHSNFGGLFPDDLKSIFPWNSFYTSTMESYLAKEEFVSGAYGIEGRYPYLDRDVVQEFLWLTADLKNSVYKSVLDNYMTTNNYPYTKNKKIGF